MNRENTTSPTTTITDLCEEISTQRNHFPAAAAAVRKVSFETHSSTKKTRKVNFSNEPVTTIHHLPNVPSASSMTPTEKQCQWYTHTELTQFRDNAKSLALQICILKNNDFMQTALQQSAQCDKNDMLPNKQRIGGNSNEFLNFVQTHARGLELRIFAKRQLKKHFAKKIILECQRQIKIKIHMAEQQNKEMGVNVNNIQLLKKVYASKLAVLSSQHTKWARVVARMTGECDYEEVYNTNNNEGVYKSNNKLQQHAATGGMLQKRKRTSTPVTPTTNKKTENLFQMKKQRREYTKLVVHPAAMNPITFVPVNVQSVQ